ncbi:MAG: hypothetical protein E7337_01085 [Clostridiales bacterium]|nr:hypothetical protein [Clostridiales bacterium]
MKAIWRITLLSLLFITLWSGMTIAAPGENSVVTLPAKLQRIEEEAFFQNTAMIHAVVPEGTVEIGPRAFAQSALKTIELPASIQTIADDAFDGVTDLTVIGIAGSYAETYCAEHAISFSAKPAEPLLESAHPYSSNTDQTWTWTGKEDTKMLRITFDEKTKVENKCDFIYLYDGSGEEIGKYTGTELQGMTIAVLDNAFSIRLVSDGYFNAYGFSITNIAEETEVNLKPVSIKSVYAQDSTLPVQSTVSWTVEVEGDFVPFTYEYVLLKNGTLYTTYPSEQSKFSLEMWSAGTYVLQVTVKDASGAEATAVCDPVTIVPNPMSLSYLLPDCETAPAGQKITWSAGCVDYIGKITYEFFLLKDGVEIDRGISSSYGVKSYSYVPLESGVYTMTVTASDENNVTVSGTSVPVTVTEPVETPATDFTYSINEENQAVITGYTGTNGYVFIPETIDGLTVGGIAEEAFSEFVVRWYEGNENVHAIVIPDSVKTIGANAFNSCANLKLVDLGYGIRRIEESAFANCTQLQEMDFPPRVEYLGDLVLGNCTGLTRITYPAELVQAGSYDFGSFKGCISLKKITVPDGVTALPAHVFSGASSLETVELPKSLSTVGEYAFMDCANLVEIALPDNVTQIGNYAFQNCTSLRTFRFPLSWQHEFAYGGSLFDGCENLTIVVPEGVTKITESRFCNQSAITEVRLPASLVEIEKNAFADCTGLTTILFSEGLETVGITAFEGCTSLKEINLPDSVVTLGMCAFEGCSALESFRYPLNWSKTSGDIFIGCSNLTTIVVPEGVKMIPVGAFTDAEGIREVYLPSSLLEIGSHAFDGCTNLQDIHFQEGLKKIDSCAFANCTSLKDADLPDSVIHMANAIFRDCTALESFHYPLNWINTVFEEYENGQVIYGGNQVGGCPKLTRIVVPEGVHIIPEFVFAGSTNIEEVVLPDSLVEIRYGAFKDCTNLRKVNIPGSVQLIEEEAFVNCGSLTVSCEWNTTGQEYAAENNISHEYLSIKDAKYPQGTLLVGQKFSFEGYLRANEPITQLRAAIYNADGSEYLQGTACQPDDTFVGLDAVLTDAFKLEDLPLGRYLFRMTATAGGKTITLVNEVFDITRKKLELDTSALNIPRYVYQEGFDFQFMGSLTTHISNEGNLDDLVFWMDWVSIEIIEETGNATVRSYVSESNIEVVEMADTQEAMAFSTLKPGMYTYRITATVGGEKRLVVETHFKIVDEETNIPRAEKIDAALRGVSNKRNDDLLYESAILSNAAYNFNSAKASLEALGFRDFEKYSIAPGAHTIGHFIGWKDIMDDDGNITRAYVILCRGTAPNREEWMSNFTLASPDGYHHGFYQAAQEVRRNFMAYVGEHAPDKWEPENFKVWIMGHSRGAAVANILGGALLVNEGYTRSNVFTYTFACPNVYDGAAPLVDNVFNYNFGGDFVPRVPLDDWGFSRYGSTITLNNGDLAFGAQMTDCQTMDDVEQMLAEVESVESLHAVFNASMDNLTLYTVDRIFQNYVFAALDVLGTAGKDISKYPDYIELLKDLGPTHDSLNYIKWIESITGR